MNSILRGTLHDSPQFHTTGRLRIYPSCSKPAAMSTSKRVILGFPTHGDMDMPDISQVLDA